MIFEKVEFHEPRKDPTTLGSYGYIRLYLEDIKKYKEYELLAKAETLAYEIIPIKVNNKRR